MERQLEKFYINLDCDPKNGDFSYTFNPDRNILEKANKYNVSVVSALINCRTPLMLIDKNSLFWTNICIGFSNKKLSYGSYQKIQNKNVQTLLYLLRDTNYEYIAKRYPNLFAIRYESFWDAINLAFNLTITQAPALNNQVNNINELMDSSCLAIFAPYINYISPTNIEFHINYSTSMEQYGFFWNKELADLFSKIFCTSCSIVEVYDGTGIRLGYRNVFTKINKKIYAPTNKTLSYHSDSNWYVDNTRFSSRLPPRSDIWPTGGCSPFVKVYNRVGINKYWIYGRSVSYFGSNTAQLGTLDFRYTPGVLPTLLTNVFGYFVTQSYNVFKLKTILTNFFTNTIRPTLPTKQSYTNAGLAMLKNFKYEKTTIWYDPHTLEVPTDKIKYGPDIDEYLINILEYEGATTHVLMRILERDVITSTKSMADIVYPIERIDVVCNNMGAKTEYLLSNNTTTVQCSNILRSFIVNSRDITSDKLSVIYTPQSELIRTDMEISGSLKNFNIDVYAYTKNSEYIKLNTFDRRSSLKLCFTKKSL